MSAAKIELNNNFPGKDYKGAFNLRHVRADGSLGPLIPLEPGTPFIVPPRTVLRILAAPTEEEIVNIESFAIGQGANIGKAYLKPGDFTYWVPITIEGT